MRTNDDLLGMCHDLDAPDAVRMTNWEATFLDSVLKLLEAGKSITAKQEKTLVDLWDEKIARNM